MIQYLMTGGPNSGTGKCMVALSADWQRDMCQQPAAFYVCTDAIQESGALVIRGETYTNVCREHHDELRASGRFRWSRPSKYAGSHLGEVPE